VPALRQRYLDYVRDIATRWLDWNAVQPMLKSAHDLIAAEVRLDTRKLYETSGFEAGIAPTGNPLKNFIDQRRAFLLRATSTTPPAVRAGTPRNNPQRGAN
jgi:hypothetical protein